MAAEGQDFVVVMMRYSDGVSEAMDHAGARFGDARFLEAIGRGRSEPLKESVAISSTSFDPTATDHSLRFPGFRPNFTRRTERFGARASETS